MKKELKYKFVYFFLIIGYVLSMFLFFKSPSLIYYGECVIIFTLIFGSIGWMIDKFRMKQPLIPIILIIIYLVVGGYIFYLKSNNGHCQSFEINYYKNIITGECKRVTIACYNSSPWYLKEDEICKETLVRERCNNLTKEEFARYNNSCDNYFRRQG